MAVSSDGTKVSTITLDFKNADLDVDAWTLAEIMLLKMISIIKVEF